jgi:NAD(P)-dependent dehydrogenase (short-subunit alcohol dehydrogenase family)
MPPVDYGLKGKVALVTGAASGIGRATAELFAREGARVVASDLHAEREEEVMAALGADAVYVPADVRDDDAVRALVARAVEEHGHVDCAANCAGVGAGYATTHEYPDDDWNRIVDINLRGIWLAMRHEVPAMTAGGTIVNVASTLGLRGSPMSSPYSASKHGVIGLTRTAAIESARALRSSLARPSASRAACCRVSGPSRNVPPEILGADHRRAASSTLEIPPVFLRVCVLARRRRHPGLPRRNVTRRPTRSTAAGASRPCRARAAR